MKNILVILTLSLCLASCKKTTTAPTPTPITPPNNACPSCPTNTYQSVGDTTWFTLQLEAPATATFNYKYDTSNVHVLLNNYRIYYTKMNISALTGQSMNQCCNFAQVGTQVDYPIKMKSGDTLTFVIDSLMYSSGGMTGDNPIRGGYIKVGKVKPTNLTQYDNMMWSADNNAVMGNPTGRHLGMANANGMGGSTQPFDWYVGKKYVYKYVKP